MSWCCKWLSWNECCFLIHFVLVFFCLVASQRRKNIFQEYTRRNRGANCCFFLFVGILLTGKMSTAAITAATGLAADAMSTLFTGRMTSSGQPETTSSTKSALTATADPSLPAPSNFLKLNEKLDQPLSVTCSRCKSSRHESNRCLFKTVICRNYMNVETGCSLGDKCRFAHGAHELPSDTVKSTSSVPTTVCKWFTLNRCQKGERCSYLHVLPTATSSSSSKVAPHATTVSSAVSSTAVSTTIRSSHSATHTTKVSTSLTSTAAVPVPVVATGASKKRKVTMNLASIRENQQQQRRMARRRDHQPSPSRSPSTTRNRSRTPERPRLIMSVPNPSNSHESARLEFDKWIIDKLDGKYRDDETYDHIRDVQTIDLICSLWAEYQSEMNENHP